MDATKRTQLTQALSALSEEIATELHARIECGAGRGATAESRALRRQAERLHADEKVGEDFDVWTNLLARRAAVLWVLKTVYVRVLEDRGLLSPRRIVDADGPQLFAKLAPNLGDTAYLSWVFRDLASPDGGLPELFSPQPAEIAPPSDALSKELLELWRKRDPDTGELVFRFDDEHFDGRLMGDLYQDLDPVVKDRFALVQTPDFIVDFILDETLTPAIAELGIDEVRLLDPACGSGHFLLAAFKRLVAGMREAHPDRPAADIVQDVLARVVGIDLNDYACALARARLVMTALELMGETDLTAGAALHPPIYWADSLEQVELEQQALNGVDENDRPRAMLTQPEVREVLAPKLTAGFHAVVGNPPFDAEADPRRRAYHREKVGKRRRYMAARGKYPLASVFAERFLQLAAKNGRVGMLCGAAFMKRQSGKGLVEKVLPRYELTKVVDLAGIPVRGAGISTVLLFAANRPAPATPITVVMAKRGDWKKADGEGPGRAWASVREGHNQIGYDSPFISVAEVAREVLAKHPWSIAGGGAAELKLLLEKNTDDDLGFATIGVAGMSNADDVFIAPARAWDRLGVDSSWRRPIVNGEDVRDWALLAPMSTFFPYDDDLELRELDGRALQALWPYRTTLWSRAVFSGGDYREAGRPWFEWHQLTRDRYRTPLTIAFGEIASHNHFAIDRGGRVFNRQAPIIKLDADADVDTHLALVAQLNSSVGDFWCKQVFHIHVGSKSAARWEYGYQRDGSKLAAFPLAARRHEGLEAFARALDELAFARARDSAAAVLARHRGAGGAAALREALDARRARDLERLYKMVGLQEELDWQCYHLYGVDPDGAADIVEPAAVLPLVPGQRSFELKMAAEQGAPGQDSDKQPTTWFERHGWQPALSLGALPEVWVPRVKARMARTESSSALSLLETPNFKRRWYRPDHEREERRALAEYLANAMEDAARRRDEPFTVRQIAASLQADVSFEAAAELYAGKGFDVDRLIAELLKSESVPNIKVHVYSEAGLVKRAAWDKTWAAQLAEDAKTSAGEASRAVPEIPPKYAKKDYLGGHYQHRKRNHDVPRERFIAYTEAPGALTHDGASPLYGWAGWTHRQRAAALVTLDERAEEVGVDTAERHGLLYGLQLLLPYVRWGDAEARSAADEYEAILRDLVGEGGVSEEMLAGWAEAHPPPKGRSAGGRKKISKKQRSKANANDASGTL